MRHTATHPMSCASQELGVLRTGLEGRGGHADGSRTSTARQLVAPRDPASLERKAVSFWGCEGGL